MQYAYFNELPIGASFVSNGNQCRKRSTRTAELIDFKRWFYFSAKELCIVGKHSRLDQNYFKGE